MIHIFISYSHEDHRWFDDPKYALMPRLIKLLEQYQEAKVWYDRGRLVGGDLWQEEIKKEIYRSDIAILLVSANFLTSEFIRKNELPHIFSRAKERRLVVIPILVGHCPYDEPDSPISVPQIIPGKPTPLIDYIESESAWDTVQNEIYESIKRQIEKLRKPREPEFTHSGSGVASTPESTIATGDESKPVAAKHKPTWLRARILYILIPIILILVGLAVFLSKSPDPCRNIASDPEFMRSLNALKGGMPWLNWIIYDPIGYDPFGTSVASTASIRLDLEILRTHGFNGLITMTSRSTCGSIPQIAHESGFNLVIAGIWDPKDKDETAAALRSADHADAYCLGHRGLNRSYSYGELDFFIKDLRCKTKKPVTTSEVIGEYEMDRRLVQIGDFLFPDAHAGWQQTPVPETAWAETASFARRAAQLASGTNKLVLLKMVSFPSGGAAGLSPEVQLNFYRLAVEQARGHVDIPSTVYFSYMTAFDPIFKNHQNNFQETEMFTGLFTSDRKPKPAVTDIQWKHHQ